MAAGKARFHLEYPSACRNICSRSREEAFNDALSREIKRRFPRIWSSFLRLRFKKAIRSGLMLEDGDFSEMTKASLAMPKHGAGRVLALLEGGYNLSLLGGSVRSHVSAMT